MALRMKRRTGTIPASARETYSTASQAQFADCTDRYDLASHAELCYGGIGC
jgi:hypothetical protein